MPSTQPQTPDPCALVIFGATGDLTKRKLLPALYNLARSGLLPEDFAIVAFARKPHPSEAFRQEIGEAMQQFAPKPFDAARWESIQARISYVAGDYGDPA